MDKINAFAINLVKRTDRKANLIAEFAGKDEFHLTVVPAILNRVGAFGLWQTICHIIKKAHEEAMDYVLVCEDDHVFTPHYSKEKLFAVISEAVEKQADVLLGGVSWSTNCLPVAKHLYWVVKFSGLQFAVIFKKFYETILDAEFHVGDAADYKMSALSDKIHFTFPFISTQKEFGYSDVTPKNNETNRVETLFKESAQRVEAIDKVIQFYKKRLGSAQRGPIAIGEMDSISISTYILSLTTGEREDSHISYQFDDKEEFDVQFVESSTHSNSEIAYWLSLRDIVQQAICNGDDVIVICESDHQFTELYNRERFIRQVVDLNELGLEVLCGGVDDFDMAVPFTKDKFWIGAFKSASFLVLYRSVFDKILETSFDEQSTRESLFRELTSNKMLLVPFISTRKTFGNSPVFNEKFTSSEVVISRLAKIRDVALSSGLI